MNELKKRIRKSGLTQKEVFERAGILYSTGNSYLNGFNPMPKDILKKIENVLTEEEQK